MSSGVPLWIPILTALISAAALISGYAYQKAKERQLEVNKKRQEIYTQLATNLIASRALLEYAVNDPDIPKPLTAQNAATFYQVIHDKYPELDERLSKGRELMTLMALYASESALQACIQYYRQVYAALTGQAPYPEPAHLVHALRVSLFGKTSASVDDITMLMAK